ncbi:MAG TPA: hypothetical protein VGR56_02785 [Nitrososphaerales archaeon]|nr:hypothetical protein [Nitrososphaerales archaeon]
MKGVTRAIQALILFSTVLGVFFLWEVDPLLPTFAFDFVAFGWVLFMVDSILTFVRPRASYYLALVLAVLALAETLSQQAHYALVASGNLTATLTIVLGSTAQALLIVLVVYFFLSSRKEDPWAWPGAKSQA